MPFQKKVKDPETDNGAGLTPGNPGDGTAAAEKKLKKSDAAAEIKLKRELYEKDKELEELRKELEAAKNQEAAEVSASSVVQAAPNQSEIDSLRAQIELLSGQVASRGKETRLLFRQPTAADVQDEAIVFTARSVIYIVASYMDNFGIEHLPPFKLITFQYAASDIRKEGREEEIKNFSQFSTNLKPEIDFLRNHPLYGITFSENTNEMMSEDTKEMEFKVQAANMIAAASPEDIYKRAESYKIPNWRSKSAAELRRPIINAMTDQFKKQAKEISEDILRRRTLGNAVLTNNE